MHIPRSLFALVPSACLAFTAPLAAQWVPQHPATIASLRGMSVLDTNTVWLSGTHGTVLWTETGGDVWQVGLIPDAASFDVRAVHAVARDTVYAMISAQDTGRIYYTANSGRTWTLQYTRAEKGLFLDALAFFDRAHGLVLGDPIDGHFTLLHTTDGGAHWTPLPAQSVPAALPGEASFAASGTALITHGVRHAWFATGGGAVARVFRTTDGGVTWHVSDTPLKAGNSESGIFSLAFADTLHGVAVGGNYATPDSTVVAAAYTMDGGATWIAVPPSRATTYLSSVTYIKTSPQSLIAVGTTGTSYSVDGGRSWKLLNRLPFNVVAGSPSGPVWAAGESGHVATLKTLTPESTAPHAPPVP